MIVLKGTSEYVKIKFKFSPMKRKRYSKGQGHGKEKSFAAMHEDLISFSGLSPVSVGHLPAGGTLGQSSLTCGGIFGSAIHRSYVLPPGAMKSVLGSWCQCIQTFAKGRQVHPLHTDMGPCGYRVCLIHGNAQHKYFSFLNLGKHQG